MFKVMIRDNMSPVAKKILEATGKIQVVVDNDKANAEPEILSEIIKEFDGLAVRSGTKVTGKVLENPTREDIRFPIQEQLIVELYSR